MKLTDLKERIYSTNGKVTITAQVDKGGSSKEEISTYLPKHGTPHKTAGKQTGNVPVYSAFNAIASGDAGETTLLLKALKGLGPYTANEKQVNWLLGEVARWLKVFIAKEKIEVFLYPKSSSDLLRDFIEKLKSEYPKILTYDNSFVKREVNNLDDEIDDFIDTEHPDFEKLGDESQTSLKKSIKRIIQKNAEDGKGFTLDAKKLFKGHAKFVKNFMRFTEDSDSIVGKRVLIIDDILSSGSTFVDMHRQLVPYAPADVSGFVLFKVVSGVK